MKALVAYYSRTGTTKKVGDEIAKELNCDVEEIIDTVNRSGILGWIKSGREGSKKVLSKIKPIGKDPALYDIVIIGTPIWAGNMSAPVRTYITENKDKFKKVAFFCTEGSRGDEATFKGMADITGQTPEGTLALMAKDISQGSYSDKLKKFSSPFKA